MLQQQPETSTVCIGIDEAGRGCLAGPVVAAAVVLPSHFSQPNAKCHITDSKKLSEKQRRLLLPYIMHNAFVGVGIAWGKEIDTINILQATFTSMARAVAALHHTITHSISPSLQLPASLLTLPLYIDGNHVIPQARWQLATPLLPYPPQRAIIEGDAKNLAIGAASIVAKTYRDTLMDKFATRYPAYGFEKHKGYGTKLHLAALEAHGVCPLHRATFAKVKKPAATQGSLFDI